MRTRLFLNKKKLLELLTLRRSGWGITSLALYFNCDESSIRYQCDKYGVSPETKTERKDGRRRTVNVERVIAQTLTYFPQKMDRWVTVAGEKRAVGKTYKEYLESRRSQSL